MPVTLRSNKRRSLHISHNVKLADITKEALSRPRSWYLPSSNVVEAAADPYTSVRKLFYDFNKQAFYGDGNGEKENKSRNVDGEFIIGDADDKTLTRPEKKRNAGLSSLSTSSLVLQKNSRNSFRKLEVKNDSGSTISRGNSVSTLTRDINNNNAEPIPVSPPTVPITMITTPPTKPPSKTPPKPPTTTTPSAKTPVTMPSFIQRTVFSSRTSETSSLKEESSSYADFYVPNSSISNRSSGNFLRRSSKRRSNDSSKFSAYDYVHHINNDDDIKSVVSSVSRFSTKSQASYPPLSSVMSPMYSKLSTIPNDDETVDPQPMIERYLRDANKDICAGIYPAADPSLTVQEDLDSDDSQQTQGQRKSSASPFIPWNKRWTFIEATYKPDEESFFRHIRISGRRSGRFATFQRSKSSLSYDPQKSLGKFSLRRMNSLDRNTIRSNRSNVSTLKRHHSEKHVKRKISNMSSTLTKHDISNDVISMPLSKHDMPRNLKLRKSSRYNKMGFDTRFFFDRYQDNLRVETFSVKVPSSFPTKPPSPNDSIESSTFTTEDPDTTPVFSVYADENLSKEFDYKLVGKTYQQLFYIRSRLSASAKKTEFMCDGSYGCGSNDLHCTPAQWV